MISMTNRQYFISKESVSMSVLSALYSSDFVKVHNKFKRLLDNIEY